MNTLVTLNLRPYNYYVLYAAIIAVLVTLVLVLIKGVLPLLRALQDLNDETVDINEKAALLNVKTEMIRTSPSSKQYANTMKKVVGYRTLQKTGKHVLRRIPKKLHPKFISKFIR